MSRTRKSKIAESIRQHDDTSVRLMADFLETAFDCAKKGELVRAMANLRNAALFEAKIPTDVKMEIYANE